MCAVPWRGKRPAVEQGEGWSLAALRSELDRLFDTLVREPMAALEWPFAGEGKWLPPVDVVETESEVIVRAELPGVAEDALELSISGDQLTLSGQKATGSEPETAEVHRREIRGGDFRRSVRLPEGVDADRAEAALVRGILTLRMPKTQPEPVRRIRVQPRT